LLRNWWSADETENAEVNTMIKFLKDATGNQFNHLLAAGLAASFAICSTASNGAFAAGKVSADMATNTNPYAGSLLRNAEMDKLATDMTKYAEVSRIVNSIVVRIPDRSLFSPGSLVSISPQGDLLLTEIGDELRDFTHNLIYVAGYAPDGKDNVESELQAMGKVDVVERELLSHQIPPSRIETEIEHRTADASGSDGDGSSAYSVELRIVPEHS
jgi:outer membrane protein OmpA-like peptidoglycan-associated protein